MPARGTIVNVSSVAGKRGWANASAYCSSKFALTGFTQALAAEAKAHGVRACIVYPGAMATHWGTWSAEERGASERTADSPRDALPPETVANLRVSKGLSGSLDADPAVAWINRDRSVSWRQSRKRSTCGMFPVGARLEPERGAR
jgi:NAD(P)-dependent dehydrogenase (short-subunit alcohol dehydrogenase family)